MIKLAFRLLVSVRAKLFFGFLCMAFLITLLGGLGLVSLSKAGNVVKTTYDRPLMAINYARAAGQRFTELARDVEYQDMSAEEAQASYAIFLEDLAVAEERNLSDRAVPFFESARTTSDAFMEQVNAGRIEEDVLHELAQNVSSDLEIIVELQTGTSFKAREAALAEVGSLRRTAMICIASALVMTLLLTVWLAITIVRPLNDAAKAAKRISSGDLDADIPKGGRDETGALLAAMDRMRSNIRERIAREQTAKDLAQERLAESLDNSKDAVVLTNPGGRIILANARVANLFPEVAQYPMSGAALGPLFDNQGLPQFGSYEWGGTAQMKSADGRWMRINASTTREGGRLFIWTDITQEMQSRAVLQQTMEQALAADRAKTDFLASMSHELRTPLNAVIGFSEIIKTESLGQSGVPQYAEMADHIFKSGKNLLEIVENVLEIASGDAGAGDFKGKPDDAAAALIKALNLVSVEARRKGVSLYHSGAREGVSVLSENDALLQIFNNLLSNAVRFTPTGGRIEARISTDPSGRVVIDVIDSGIGIPADRIDDVKRPFVQIESGRKRSFDGVGLGLTIVDRLASRLGGQFLLSSELGAGTTARVVLPVFNSLRTRPRPPQMPPMATAPSSAPASETDADTQGAVAA